MFAITIDSTIMKTKPESKLKQCLKERDKEKAGKNK
jgi:hypothetical protein